MKSLDDGQTNLRCYSVLATCGCGHDGRLGFGDPLHPQAVLSTSELTLIPFFMEMASASSPQDVDTARSVHCGGYHTIVLTEKGILYGWGVNEDGQLGLGSREGGNLRKPCYTNPTRITFFDDLFQSFCVGRRGSTKPESSGQSSSSFAPSPSVEKGDRSDFILDVSCGAHHSMVLTRSGLYVCGRNTFGQLGLGKETAAVLKWTPLLSLFAPGHELSDRMVVPSDDKDGVQEEAILSYLTLDATSSPFFTTGESSSVLLHLGEITHISCGTHHSLLAFKNAALERPGGREGNNLIEFYPILLFAAGKGDYGELGYNGDVFSVLHTKEKRQEATLLKEVKHSAMQGEAVTTTYSGFSGWKGLNGGIPMGVDSSNGSSQRNTGSSSSADRFSSGWWKRQRKKERRPEFFSLHFLPVVFEELNRLVVKIPRETLTATSNSMDRYANEQQMMRKLQMGAAAVKQDQEVSNPSLRDVAPVSRVKVTSMKAMHLHSMVTLEHLLPAVEAGARKDTLRREVWHWGCYYCNEVEGLESSIPMQEVWEDEAAQPVDMGDAGSQFSIHAANEVLYRYGDSHSSVASGAVVLAAKGSGALVGVGDEDAFEPDWKRIDVPPWSHIKDVHGKDHVLFLVERHVSPPGTSQDGVSRADAGVQGSVVSSTSVGFLSTSSVTEVWGMGENLHGQLGQGTVDVVPSPIPVLRPGDEVRLPSSALLALRLREGEDTDQGEGVWKVVRIRGTAVGVNHSMFLVDIVKKHGE